MNTIQKILNSLSNLGISKDTPVGDITYYKNLNTILFTYYLLFILNFPVLAYYYPSSQPVIVAFAIAFAAWTVGIFINYIKQHTIAIFLSLAIGCTFVLYLYQIMGYRALNQLYVIVSITRVFSIFPERKKKLIPIAVLILVGTMFYIEYCEIENPVITNLDPNFIETYSYLTLSLVGFSVLSIGLQTYKSFISYEKQILLSNKNAIDAYAKLNEQTHSLTESINYAKKIQNAILPKPSVIAKDLNDYFILYKPKDIVSGDFYWHTKIGNKTLIAAADCTGHGVPGALMSMVSYELLNIIVNEHKVTEPAEILNNLRELLWHTLNQDTDTDLQNDGLDIALCSIDFDTMELCYSGAHNPLWLIRNNEFTETRANKLNIGGEFDQDSRFTNHTIKIQTGDLLYIFSDGYPDQFGGEKFKKFGKKRFRELIKNTAQLPFVEQKIHLQKTLADWQLNNKQTDDIVVIGFKI